MTVLLAALACAATALFAGTATAAEGPCWQLVVSDWTDGQLDGAYAPACYRQALQHLPEDLRTYSSAPDDINRALLEATQQKRSIASSHSSARALEASVVPAADRTPLAVVLIGALGATVVLTGTLSALLLARRRRARM